MVSAAALLTLRKHAKKRPSRLRKKAKATSARRHELDAQALAHTGQRFNAFVSFAQRAQRQHGYVPSVVAPGSRPEQREDAERFARALEQRGVKVWRGFSPPAPAKKKKPAKKTAKKRAALPTRKRAKHETRAAAKNRQKRKGGLASLPDGFLRRIAAAGGAKASAARAELARRR